MRTRELLVMILISVAAVAHAQTIGVWDAPVPGELLAANSDALTALLTAEGYEVRKLSTDELLDATTLSPAELHMVLIPTIGVYPPEGVPVLREYLQAGGTMVSMGGVPFDRRLQKSDGQWQALMLPDDPTDEVRAIADFEAGIPEGLLTVQGGEGEDFGFEVVDHEGEAGKYLRASVSELGQYEYVRINLADTGDDSFSILHFRARGDENSATLGMEMNESDESRWKMVLPLSTEWRDYTIFIPHMLSYATEDRGDEGDQLHPSKLLRVSLGFTKGMVGGGAHRIDLDDVQRWRFASSKPEAISWSTRMIAATVDAYGDLVKTPGESDPLATLFADAVEAADGGWSVTVSDLSPPLEKDGSLGRRRVGRVRGLSVEDGNAIPGMVANFHDGDLAGASLAAITLNETELLDQPLPQKTLLETLSYLLRCPRIVALEPSFGVEDGKPEMTLTATVAGPALGADEVWCALTYSPGLNELAPEQVPQTLAMTGVPQSTHAATLAPRERIHISERLPTGPLFSTSQYRASAAVWVDDELSDTAEFTVDVRGVMGDLCDFLVERQTEEGTFTGSGFVDERAARGLLAMYDITGDERYRDAAIRWGEHEIDIQREDGGYRMGYGIGTQGEACYVADGGEIAIGMVRLLNYVPEDRRAAFAESLQRYFDYRESFRLDDGTISVGWVITGMWMRDYPDDSKLEKAMRSDVSRGFVVGCTLASAAAFAHVTGEAADRAMVVHDSRWFLDDGIKTTSVMAEAAQWAHYFTPDEGLRGEFAQRMKKTLVPWMPDSRSWWYASGGRAGVTLSALNYYATQIEADPVAQAQVMRGIYEMVSEAVPVLRGSEHGGSAAAAGDAGGNWGVEFACGGAREGKAKDTD